MKTPADAEERLNEVLLAYLEAAQAGWAPRPDRVLAAYPDLKADLAEFFASRAEVERLAGPIRDAAQAGRDELEGEGEESILDPRIGSDLGTLGDFRLLREVGRGGMGVVYEAEQISLRRRVALKVLPFAAAIDSRQLQRFRTEAMAAANLRHEHVVPVFAVGTERGVHYYAMQFVDGQSLATLIEGMRRPGVVEGEVAHDPDATGPQFPSHPADTRAALADRTVSDSLVRDRGSRVRQYANWVANLGRQAALALEHAHQMGIVHRDVKPANLLLDSRGEIWVADFGLAQVSTDAGLTVTGEVLGTLRYASPEQVLAKRGLVDHRSDIYSLGATLYELLALRPMFDGKDRHELLRQIAVQEPTAPGANVPGLPRELDTIILKAVAKDPHDRYATAHDFAEDLKRFIEDRPVLARRPSLLDRGRKWVRRHPAALITALVVLGIGVIGLAAATALVAREQQRTTAALDGERRRAEEAEQRFQLARRLADDMIQMADGDTFEINQQPLRRQLLESALNYYQEFIELRRDDPGAQADLEPTRDKARTILADLALLRGAERHFMLFESAVRDDLDLSSDQRAKIDQLFRDVGGFPGPHTSNQERSKSMMTEIKAHEAAIREVLSTKQFRRLGQIHIQVRGPAAFREPEVVAALGLTKDQRDRLRDAEFGVMFIKDGGPPPKGPPRFDPRLGVERLLGFLSDEQRDQWHELIGEKYNGPIFNMFRGPGPGGPGGPPFKKK